MLNFNNFLQILCLEIYKNESSKSFNIKQILTNVKIKRKTLKKYRLKLDQLIKDGEIDFIKKSNTKNHYIKTFRIKEICQRTLNELKEDDTIDKRVINLIEINPYILHEEFVKWLNLPQQSMLSWIIDKYWHNFIIYTFEYKNWCLINYGRYINHIPHLEYIKKTSNYNDILSSNIDFLIEYKKHHKITKTILLYNLPLKLYSSGIKYKKIKKIILDF